MKLHQIIAIISGRRDNLESLVAKTRRALKAEKLLLGISKTYKPSQEDGETFPGEVKKVQVKVAEVLVNFLTG